MVHLTVKMSRSGGGGRGETAVPVKVKKNVRSVLLSSPKGVLLRKFCGDYRALVKEPFPWKSLGKREREREGESMCESLHK